MKKIWIMRDIIEKNRKNLIEYCQKYDVDKLYAFGSICTDDFTDKSDIDLLVSFKDISIEKYTDNYFLLHELFEKLFKRPIDLVTERSLSNPFFIKVLNKTKTVIYEG